MDMSKLEAKLERASEIQKAVEKNAARMEGHSGLWKHAVMTGDGEAETLHRNALMECYSANLDCIAELVMITQR